MRGFMRGFGNRIIAHARRLSALLELPSLNVTALDAAQDDRKEA